MEFYRPTRDDLPRVVECLRRAFRDDPLWNEVFRDDPNKAESLNSFFTIPVLYGIRFGQVYASSPGIEGVFVLLPSKHAGMPLWGLLLSGALKYGSRMGRTSLNNLAILSKQLGPSRKRMMGGKPYQYLIIIGVDPDHQGKGHGSRFMSAIVDQCDQERLHLYLETEIEDNIPFYEKHGLEVLQKVEIQKLQLPVWQMTYVPE